MRWIVGIVFWSTLRDGDDVIEISMLITLSWQSWIMSIGKMVRLVKKKWRDKKEKCK